MTETSRLPGAALLLATLVLAAPAPAQTMPAAAGTGTMAPVPSGGPDFQRLLGATLRGADGRDAGRVENLVTDARGQVRGLVVEWGGFLGIGERRAVVPVERLRLEGDSVRLDMTRAQLEELGSFDRNRLSDLGTRFGWGEGLRLAR